MRGSKEKLPEYVWYIKTPHKFIGPYANKPSERICRREAGIPFRFELVPPPVNWESIKYWTEAGAPIYRAE